MCSIEGWNRDTNVDEPRISSSISRSSIALSASSFSKARSGSTVNSRSRVTCSLKSSLKVLLGSGSISAVWISLLYVTRSCKPTVSRVLAAQERRHRTLCGSSNNSCWTSIRSGVNLGVTGLRHGVVIRPRGLLEYKRTGRLHSQSQIAQESRQNSPYQNLRCLCGSLFLKHGAKRAPGDQGDQAKVFRGPKMQASSQGYEGQGYEARMYHQDPESNSILH